MTNEDHARTGIAARVRNRIDGLRSRRAVALATAAAAVLAVAAAAIWFRPSGPELPDFAGIEPVAERKQAFFRFLAPIVREENARVLEDRKRLLRIAEQAAHGDAPGWLDRRWLRHTAGRYEVEWNPEQPLAVLEPLRQRIDVVPVALALVQAATESGWGRSRFAVEANNLFGHWCYEPGCGLVPGQRASGAAHEVAAFESVRQSVRRYLHNLNTHHAYQPLRAIRARMRREDERLSAMALADGLLQYSQRREAYVEEIKTVIRVNRPVLADSGVTL